MKNKVEKMVESHENHEHHHNVKLFFILYLIGLFIFIVTLFFKMGENITLFGYTFDNKYILIPIYYLILMLSGYHVIEEGIEDTVKQTKKKKRFTPNVHILMLLAAIGALIIGEYNEAVLLILIFAGAHFLEDFASEKSTKEIKKLLNLNKSKAFLINEDGTISEVLSDTLKIGDRVRVLNGSSIPSDGIIIEGHSEINEANITGESIPAYKKVGDQVFGSTINGEGILIVEINKNSDETVLAKIIELVSQTQNDLSKTAVLIKKIEPIYVNIVLIFAPIFFLLGQYLFKWDNAFYRTMVLLIGASPCALAVTDIPATLSAISNLAKNGILFKGGSYLEIMADLDVVAFDKTGTLTTGYPVVTDVIRISKENINYYDNIIYHMEDNSNHPLAKALTSHFKKIDDINIEVINKIGLGVYTNYNNHEYQIFKPLEEDLSDSNTKDIINNLQNEGKTVVILKEDFKTISIIGLIDNIKESSIDAIAELNKLNVETVMITGDAKNTANTIAKKLNITTVHANVLPTEKASIIKSYRDDNKIISMVGDGINDAPALATSSIGVAMGSGTDIAIDVADAVLMKNDLNKFVYTYKVAKKLKRVVIQNIIFAMTVVLFLLVTNIIGIMEMPLAVVIHEGSTLVVILSGLRLLRTIKK